MPQDLIFATEKTLIQPKGGLIVEAPLDQDHVLGAKTAIAGPDFEVLVSDGQWGAFAPVPELQRNEKGDTFMCVSFSAQNISEFLMQKLYGETVNWSDLHLGVGSGTKRGQGNGKRAVAEWRRLNGFVTETEYPYTPGMSLDQVYAPLPPALLVKGKKNLDLIAFFYKWLPGNSVNDLLEGLKFSPLQVDVTGNYQMDAKGNVVFDGGPYAHEVVIFGYEPGKAWHVFDSEASQFLRFAWNYPFGSPMVHALKKKNKPMIYKKKGQSGLAVKTFGEPSMIFFSGGSVIGEALFKSIYGVTDFSQIEITEVDEWPFPPRHILNCNVYTNF